MFRIDALHYFMYYVHDEVHWSKDTPDVSHAIEFIETPTFTRQIQAMATDDELKELQRILIAQPDKGDLIQGTGGLRKIRMALGHQGKQGGARIIYFLATAEVVYLILAYPKSVKDSLTPAEKATLKTLTHQLKGEVLE
ncbi:type II toxin-antitoxin system RelE/ParE family toxin [Modicisalibacter zincidurans]|uniref:Type II toxin-antitoxin system RelE/ParE family toxin n=1 Tax=Modicisalibacter zincidurans TaxID=1178777 RepID=A0ABP9QZD2_9GAMM